jgi:plastocyanin
MRKPPFVAVLAIAVLTGLLVGCSAPNGTTTTAPSGSTTTGGGSTTTVAAGQFQVTIDGFAFTPPELTVPVGTTVTWTNNHAANHTVTSDTGVFDSGTMAQGATFAFTFTEAGEFPYHCSIHSSMTAKIIVTG